VGEYIEYIQLFGSIPLQFVIAVSGLLAAIIAVVTVVTARRTARQANATALMMELSETNHLGKGLELLRRMHNNPKESIETVAKNPNDNTPEEINIRRVLNYYESLSAGVRRGIYDEKIIRDNRRTSILSIWQMTKPYIQKLRDEEENTAFYEHLEWLVNRFCNKHPSWKCGWLPCRFINHT